MTAWAYGSPENAGSALLPLIELALRDEDKEVRGHGLKTLARVESEANAARVSNRPVITDPASYRPLYDTLLDLLDHPDLMLRQGAVLALATYELPPSEALEAEILTRLPTQADAGTRAHMMTLLAGRARLGSRRAREAVLAGLEDSSVAVQVSAANALGRLRVPEALPKLRKLSMTLRHQG
jgi:HEAT repeat protein